MSLANKAVFILIFIFIFPGFINLKHSIAQSEGELKYKQLCAACHSIGGGRLVGPDLKSVSERRSEQWLIKWIQSSQSMVNAGDVEAKKLFDEYKMPMPDQPLDDNQVKKVLLYIQEQSGGSVKANSGATHSSESSSVPAPLEDSLSPDAIAKGQNSFQGKLRFNAGAPACISCHSVDSGSLITGGALAKELTTSYSRLSEQGVKAILSNPPFPVMKEAFEGRALTEDEIQNLVSFLKFADRENKLHQPREYGIFMIITGVIGVIFLFGFYAFIGRKRKIESVNQKIYDRQIRSE